MADDLQPALDLYPDGQPYPDPRKPPDTRKPQEQPWVQSPGEHGELIHGGGKGCVSISHKTSTDRWKERIHGVEAALELLKHCRGQEDLYLSTQRFRGRRRITYLLSLSELYADLDYYRVPELVGADPRRLLEMALSTLRRSSMPEPSLAISSGRGLYLLWLHAPIPRSALPRWEACQKQLQRVLASLGADPMATDAARVLRIVGTLHTKAGAMVEAITPAGEPWSFNKLADQVLPVTRAELHDLRVQRALRAPRSPPERQHAPPEGFTAATLWEARLSDLQKLRELRWFGEPMPDFRDRWMFVAGVGMSWLAIPGVLRRELFALAREVGGWSEGKTRSKMHAIFRTAHESAQGKKVAWRGLEVDPRYRLRNQTIIEWLEITSEEEREMRTLISDEERRRRDRERKEPEMSRQEYLTRAAKRRAAARRLSAEDLSVRQIGKRLGVHHTTIVKALRDAEDEGW